MSWLEVGTWIVTIMCLVGTVLNVKKIKWCFYIWAVANVLWFAYDIYVKLYSRAVLDFVQLCFAIWGAIEWSRTKDKKEIKQQSESKNEHNSTEVVSG